MTTKLYAIMVVLLTALITLSGDFTGAGEWQLTVVDSDGDVGWSTSLALDSNDNPHISYYDITNSDLKYASYDGTWHTETIDSTGYVGRSTSLAIDSTENPHIGYYSDSNHDLKYSWYNDTWYTETVDSTGYVGRNTSLALDSNDNPHISYYDDTNDDLKYAISIFLCHNDFDCDGILDPYDNCPYIANADQSDADNDQIGNACDENPEVFDYLPVADGHYDRSYFCCPEDPPICGGCFDDYEIVENGIKVTYYYDSNVSCGALCGLPGSSLSLRMGIVEFDISGLSGLFIRGQLQATLHLTVKSGDLLVDRCLSFYSIQDANENGMVEVVDKDIEDYVGEICENLQPGDTISIDVTSALEHDAFDPDQTNFSGFVIGRSTNWSDTIEFYDHTDPENGPRLSVIDTQCEGNFDCDQDCDGTDAALFKSDFGRSSFNNPCPTCVIGDWCVYE